MRLNREEPLFEELEQYNYKKELAPKWWVVIRDDKELYVEAREQGYLDIMYRGVAIVQNLRWSKEAGYTASIKAKYLYDLDSNEDKECPLDMLPELLSDIKNRIVRLFPFSSDLERMAKLIIDKGTYLDSRVQFGMQNFNLIKADTANNNIVFQLFSTVQDIRIHADYSERGAALNQIKKQIEQYRMFIIEHENELLRYYTDVAYVKRMMGVLPDAIWFSFNAYDFSDYSIDPMPELVISDYDEPYTEDSEKGEHIKTLIKELDETGVRYSFVNIQIDGYLYKRHLESLPSEEWISIFRMIPWLERIGKIDPAEIYTDHRGARTRPLKYVEYKSASVQLIGRCNPIIRTHFDWKNWQQGRDLLADTSGSYEGLDIVTLCKLLAIILYYKEQFDQPHSLIYCNPHDLEDGRVLKILKAMKQNFVARHRFAAYDIRA